MATILSRPRLFDSLSFTVGVVDADGYRVDTAPCGCSIERRVIYPDRGVPYLTGDVRCEVCDQHTQTCPECGQQTWPHSDCRCDQPPRTE